MCPTRPRCMGSARTPTSRGQPKRALEGRVRGGPGQVGIDHSLPVPGVAVPGVAVPQVGTGRGVGQPLSPPLGRAFGAPRGIPVGGVEPSRLPTRLLPGVRLSVRQLPARVGRGGHVRAGADPVKTAFVGPGAARSQHERWGPGEVDFPGWGEAAAVSRSGPGPALTQRAALTFTAPTTLVTTLGTPPTHPDPCPGAPTHGPRDLSAGLPRPPSTGPERLAPPHPGLADEEVDGRVLGNTQGAGAGDSEPLLGATATACPWAGRAREGEEGEPAGEPGQEECPICTEPYGPSEHRLALLNCGHGLCVDCLHQLLVAAPSADLGRVCCPLCRQRTPMLEWEICQLQKELLQADGPQGPRPPTPPAPARRGPGPWASLEHRYQLRFLAGPVGGRGCLPFLPCPPCLGARLWALRERGPCSRRLVLLGLLALELLGLLLIFTPLMLLGLLFMLLDRAGH